MAVGLDWGTSTVIACRNVASPEDPTKKFPKYRHQRNCYIEIEANEYIEAVIQKAKMSYVRLENDPKIYVIGSDAIQLASTISNIDNKVEIKRPMRSGVMVGDPIATKIMQAISHSVLQDPEEKDELLVYSVPADPIDADFKTFYHTGMTEMTLKSIGWNAMPINEALAIIYAEAPSMYNEELDEEVPFTGIAISCGGGMINVCLAYRGLETMSFSLANAYRMGEGCAGDWIDKQVFRAKEDQFGSIGKVTLYKENFINFNKDIDVLASEVANKSNIYRGNIAWHKEALLVIKIYYEKLLDYIIDRLVEEFRRRNPTIEGKLSIVLAGGTSSPEGFENLFKERLQRKELPFEVKDIIKPANPVRSVAKGCMVAAEIGFKK